MDIEKAFAKHFPNKKLTHAFRNSSGKTHLEFDSTDAAADIMQNWNKGAMGTDTSVTNPRGKHRQNALIIRRVDTGISEETLAEQISEQLHTDIEKVTIRRFIKKPDNAKMTTVKVDLQERTMLETVLANGFLSTSCFQTYRIHRENKYSRDQMLQLPEIWPYSIILQTGSKMW